MNPWEDFENYNCGLDSDNIIKFSMEVLKDQEHVKRVNKLVVKYWLLEVNS